MHTHRFVDEMHARPVLEQTAHHLCSKNKCMCQNMYRRVKRACGAS